MNTDTTPQSSQARPVHPRAANRGWLHRARAAGLAGGALLSFLALGLYASAEGEAFVSQVRLAADVGVTDRTIRNHVRRWQRAGLLDARTRVGPRGLTLYRLAAPDLAAAGIGPGLAHVPLDTPPARAESAPRHAEGRWPARAESRRPTDRNRLVPLKTVGGRESVSDLSPAVVPQHHPREPWPRAPRPLAPSAPAAAPAPRGPAYSPRGDAHPAAVAGAPARALHGPATATRPTDAGALSVLRGALVALRAAAVERAAVERAASVTRAESPRPVERAASPSTAPEEPPSRAESPRPVGELLPPLLRG